MLDILGLAGFSVYIILVLLCFIIILIPLLYVKFIGKTVAEMFFELDKTKFGYKYNSFGAMVLNRYIDKLTGKIIIDSKKDIDLEEIWLYMTVGANLKESALDYESGRKLIEKWKIVVEKNIQLRRGQQYKKLFQVDIPFLQNPKPDQYAGVFVALRGIASIKKDMHPFAIYTKRQIEFSY